MADWKEPVRKLLTGLLRLVKEPSPKDEIIKRLKKETALDKVGIPRWLLGMIFFVLAVLIIFVRKEMSWPLLAGYMMVVFIFVVLIGVYMYRYAPKVMAKKDNIILIGSIAMSGLVIVVSHLIWGGK